MSISEVSCSGTACSNVNKATCTEESRTTYSISHSCGGGGGGGDCVEVCDQQMPEAGVSRM